MIMMKLKVKAQYLYNELATVGYNTGKMTAITDDVYRQTYIANF